METNGENHSNGDITEKDILGISWDYFQLHANQRMNCFNFFIVFSSLLSTGLLTTFQKDFKVHYIGIALGILQMFLSFIFWQIDVRNKNLIKNGENVIKNIETNYLQTHPEKLCVFLTEETETNKSTKKDEVDPNESTKNKKPLFQKSMSIRRAFNFIFLIFFIFGLLGASLSIIIWVIDNPQTQTSVEFEIINQIDAIESNMQNLLNNITQLEKNIESNDNEENNQILQIQNNLEEIKKFLDKINIENPNNILE
jgi:predicted PurR-regulated permease PerM